ncbi:MAG TPA: acetate--CoA ligase family protein [Syntrophorhabdales bacterium]|nr:acetate--CoA ligase family protein [Syntrophorhabdales bacterium]
MKLLLGVEALSFMEKEGFLVLKAGLAGNPDEAVLIAERIGFPVALKISSPDVLHKTDEQGVRLFLASEGEVRKAFHELSEGFVSRAPRKRLDGTIVQQMGSGVEVIVGSLIDGQFGPVLMFGLGGIFAESTRDVSFRPLPINHHDAGEMIRDLRASRVLTNPRGERIDVTAIEQLLVQVSDLIARHEEIQEMDLNPVIVSSCGLHICDARIKAATE